MFVAVVDDVALDVDDITIEDSISRWQGTPKNWNGWFCYFTFWKHKYSFGLSKNTKNQQTQQEMDFPWNFYKAK